MISPRRSALIDAAANCRHGAVVCCSLIDGHDGYFRIRARNDARQAQRVLVLQGGGALGSYQAGAFQALCRAGFEPEWVAGISIGAINAAIIAGNAPDKRVDRAEGILGDGVVAGVLESGDARATARARCSTRPAPP